MTLFGDEHVARYEATDGAEGYEWRNGTVILILTTQGRKSGETRKHALIYREWDDARQPPLPTKVFAAKAPYKVKLSIESWQFQ